MKHTPLVLKHRRNQAAENREDVKGKIRIKKKSRGERAREGVREGSV